MSKLRHWKQHWDPEAPLCFRKRMKLGVCGKEYVEPGDPVTPEIVAALGPAAKARLRRWWEAGRVEIADWAPPEELRKRQPEERLAEPVPTGRGWYAVTAPDGAVHKVRGIESARARRDELWGPEAQVEATAAAMRDRLRMELEAACGEPEDARGDSGAGSVSGKDDHEGGAGHHCEPVAGAE